MLLQFGLPLSAFAETRSLMVEGIISEKGEFVAVINGDLVKAGGQVGGYEILSVDAKGVQARDTQSGKTLYVAAGDKPAPPKEKKGWGEKMVEKHLPKLAQINASFEYAGVIRDLKTLHREAYMYYIDSGAYNVSVADLVAKRKLPAFFRDGSHGYRYRVEAHTSGVRAFADPVEKNSPKKHFMIDEHSYVYAEEKRTATPQSPRFENSYSVEVKPSP
ncbi:MAG: hypothetical protein L0Z48_10890 [candidate division Zixibacteria bacterium]|nr:hypothetical protein [candidate division Zixibacteria bacterium]